MLREARFCTTHHLMQLRGLASMTVSPSTRECDEGDQAPAATQQLPHTSCHLAQLFAQA